MRGKSMVEIRPASAVDTPVLLKLIHTAFEELRDRLDPPSGAHAESIDSLQTLFARGERAALNCWPKTATIRFHPRPGISYRVRSITCAVI
jgi:hypothetical protein